MRLPLPLELTNPVVLAADLDTQLRDSLGVGKYDRKTQMAWGGDGSHCSQESESQFNLVVIDVQLDVQIDDNDF